MQLAHLHSEEATWLSIAVVDLPTRPILSGRALMMQFNLFMQSPPFLSVKLFPCSQEVGLSAMLCRLVAEPTLCTEFCHSQATNLSYICRHDKIKCKNRVYYHTATNICEQLYIIGFQIKYHFKMYNTPHVLQFFWIFAHPIALSFFSHITWSLW